MKYVIRDDVPPLGSFAGTPAKISSHEIENQFTEGRIFKDEGNNFYTYGAYIVSCRDELFASEGLPGNHFKNVGEKHHNSGTSFKTVYTCKDYSSPGKGPMDNYFAYAIQSFGFKLERVAKKEMSEIVKSVSCSIDEAITNYFEPIMGSPKDGDLVVYQSQYTNLLLDGSLIKAGSNTHAGIYRDTKSNGHSPNGGTVESKWGWWGNSFVFQHDMFFVPTCYGDIIKFYRLKPEELSLNNSIFAQENLFLTGDIIDLN